MDGPAQAAMRELLERAAKNPDGFATLVRKVEQLAKNGQELAKHPNALPRLLDLSEAAFHRAISSPAALKEAIRRAEFADEGVGKKLSDLSPIEKQTLRQGYVIQDGKTLRRKNVDEGYTQLQIDKNGVIQQGAGKVSDRLSNSGKAKKNLERSLGSQIPDGHQVHHLIPDSIVRDHELTQLAQQFGYDLDRASNLMALPYTDEAFVHLGSHPQWSKHVEKVLKNKIDELKQSFGTDNLKDVPPDALKEALDKTLREVEQQLRRDIQDLNLGRQKNWIQLDSNGNPKLSLSEPASAPTPTEALTPEIYQAACKCVRQTLDSPALDGQILDTYIAVGLLNGGDSPQTVAAVLQFSPQVQERLEQDFDKAVSYIQACLEQAQELNQPSTQVAQAATREGPELGLG